MNGPRLRHVEMPLAPGAVITVECPAGDETFGVGPFLDGQGFTVDANGERWRAVLRSVSAGLGGVTLELEVEGRYPQDA